MAKESLTISVTPAMRDWLQIRTKESLDYFALLGLSRDVGDEKAIETAILERSKTLRKWQNSPQYGTESVKLLSIVHRAGKILKDPRRRDAYRQELLRQERGESMDSRDEFRSLVRAAMADSLFDAGARAELMRYAGEHALSQSAAQEIVAQVREELSAARAAETPTKPQDDTGWEFRIAEEGEEGFLLTLSGMESNAGDFTEVSLASLMAQAAKYRIPPERAALLMTEYQKNRFKRMIKRVAAGGIISEAQVRLILPKAAAYGLDQRQAYDLIADYTLSARSTEDALKALAYAQTFSDADINSIIENKPAPRRRRGFFNGALPDWLRNLLLIGAASIALVGLVLWLKGAFQAPRDRIQANLTTSATPQATATPAVDAGTPTPAAATPSPTPTISLEEMPDPPSGMLAFKPQRQEDPPPFEIAVSEVTCAQYDEYLKATLETAPAGWTGPSEMPVTGLSYQKALDYCTWRAEREAWPKGSVTLPSQAEFLRAASGRTTRGYPTDKASNFWSRAQLGKGVGPALVHQNPFDKIFTGYGQLYDLMGNVAEWGRESRDGQQAILGGDFMQTAPDFNPLATRWVAQSTTSPTLGFRIVHHLGP